MLRGIPMLNPFHDIRKSEARRFTALPAKFRGKRRTAWSDPNRAGAPVDSFLEGPSFDRDGNLWCVDIPFGRIFRARRADVYCDAFVVARYEYGVSSHPASGVPLSAAPSSPSAS